jgi:hypothetical protein
MRIKFFFLISDIVAFSSRVRRTKVYEHHVKGKSYAAETISDIGRDLADWLKRLTANVKVPGSIPVLNKVHQS